MTVALNLSTTASVTITLPADSSRPSRLAATGDVTVQRYRIDGYNAGIHGYSYEVLRTGSVKNITNFVEYRW